MTDTEKIEQLLADLPPEHQESMRQVFQRALAQSAELRAINRQFEESMRTFAEACRRHAPTLFQFR